MLPVENTTSVSDVQLERRLKKKFGEAYIENVTETEVKSAAEEILAHIRQDVVLRNVNWARIARSRVVSSGVGYRFERGF